MNWRDIWVLYCMELRSALRERSIVVNSVLVPLLLYPLMMWGIMTGLTFVMGQNENLVSRIAITGESAPGVLSTRLGELENVELVAEVSPQAADEMIRQEQLDALVAVTGSSIEEAKGDLRFHLLYDGSKDRSAKARERIVEQIDEMRGEHRDEQAETAGVSPRDWQQYWINTENVASSRQMGGFIMGLMIPMFLIIMVSAGAMYPAVDSTAGERERGTWETLMSTAASPASIVTAKYLYVTTMATMAGLLNLAAMLLSMRAIFAPLLARTGEQIEFTIPLGAIPVMALGALLLAAFVSAGMMVLASFARTFKEGQSMAAPLYMVSFLPILFINSPGIELTPRLALIPVVNIALVFREALSDIYQWPLIALAVFVELLLVVLLLALARQVLRFEDVLLGSFSGSLFRFIKLRLFKSSGS